MKNNGIKTPDMRNKNYFQSLIATRASIGMLINGIAGAAISGICYGVHNMTATYYGVEPPKDILSQLLIFSIFFMLISFFVNPIEPLRHFFYRYQRFSSIWQFLFVFLLYFSLAILCAILFLTDENMLDIYGSPFSLPFLIGGVALYSLCIAYNINWLKKELEEGMSEERTQKNYLAKSIVTSPTSLVLIFGLTMLSPILIKGSMEAGLGLTMFVLFTGAFSRLHVEYVYAAVLKWRDKEYWEEYRREEGLTIPRTKLLFVIRLMVEIGVFFGTIYFVSEFVEQGSPLIFPLRLVVLAMLFYWLIRILLWLKRKYFTGNTK